MKQAELKGIAERYAAFAIDEARGSSQAYEKLALAIAQSGDLLQFIATFRSKSVSRIFFLPLFGTSAAFREVMLSRTTQTNEPARCAVLLPLLAQLAQPLALIESADPRDYACAPQTREERLI